MTGPYLSHRLLLAALFAGAAAACGGEDQSRPEGNSLENSAPLDACELSQQYEQMIIQEFEGGAAVGWYVSSDMTPGSNVEPLGETIPSTPLEEPRCGSALRALHVTATGLLEFGGSVGFSWQPPSFDASEYDGLSFWARRGENSQGQSLLAAVTDKYTDQNGAPRVDPVEDDPLDTLPECTNPDPMQCPREPYCVFEAPIDAIKCDKFGAGVGLDTEWQFYAIRFDEMAQGGFGRPSRFDSPDTDELLGIQFGFEAGDWDFWIDDVALFRSPSEEE